MLGRWDIGLAWRSRRGPSHSASGTRYEVGEGRGSVWSSGCFSGGG
jgi:hypothetical protein